jgi:two-component system chemotaxis response regulator CheB
MQGNRKQKPKPTSLTCPECGGPLSQDRDGIFSHFRCRVGHAFSLRSLKEAQETRAEAGIWAAMQSLEESSEITRRLAKEARNRGDETEAVLYDGVVDEALRRAKALREVLEKSQ